MKAAAVTVAALIIANIVAELQDPRRRVAELENK